MKLFAVLPIVMVLFVAGCTTDTGPPPPPPDTHGEPGHIDPEVSVSDQTITAGTVTITSVVSLGPGWLVVHADDNGKPGTVIGQTAVSEGTNTNVVVEIDTSQATETLHAMLHADEGEVGTYEFPGDDAPVKHEDKIVNVPFTATPEGELIPSVSVSDQTISEGTVTITSVVSLGSGWLVVHADDNGAPGTVLGQTAVSEGTNSNVVVSIDLSQATETLHAMLHSDEGEVGTYEFPGDDAPVKHEDVIVNVPFTATQAAGTVEFSITARQWEFEPSTITVQKGQTVKLSITSEDVTHGFAISEYGITEVLTPGNTVTVEFVADQSGTFNNFCTVFCGSGHSGMKGTFIVEE